MAGGPDESGVGALPWPNVRGKRCLVRAGAGAPDLRAALGARGAASVDDDVDGLYDVVVAWGVLAGAPDAGDQAHALRKATRGVAVSCEPIDLWSSLWSRGRPLFTPAADGAFGFNGAGHRYLLEQAGFSIERVSKPFTVPGDEPPPGPLAGLALRAVTGRAGSGRLHRALLARPADA